MKQRVCPSCSKVSSQHSRREPWERAVGLVLPFRPHRCLGCYKRFWSWDEQFWRPGRTGIWVFLLLFGVALSRQEDGQTPPLPLEATSSGSDTQPSSVDGSSTASTATPPPSRATPVRPASEFPLALVAEAETRSPHSENPAGPAESAVNAGQLEQENSRLRQDFDALDTLRLALEEDLEAAQGSLTEQRTLGSRLAELQGRTDRYQSDLTEAEQEKARLDAELATVRAELSTTAGAGDLRATELQQQLAIAQDARTVLRSELDQLSASGAREQSALTDRLAALERDLQKARTALSASQDKLALARAGAGDAEAELRRQLQDARTAGADVVAQLNEARSAGERDGAERSKLTDRLAVLERDLQQARSALETPETRVAEVETSPVPAPTPLGRQPEAAPSTESTQTAVRDASTTPSSEESVLEAVESWAEAWSEQRVEDYLAAYSQSFDPPRGLGRADWEQQRRTRLTRPTFIRVILGQVSLRLSGGSRARVTFRQSYESNTFKDITDKILVLTLEEGRWKILEERSSN